VIICAYNCLLWRTGGCYARQYSSHDKPRCDPLERLRSERSGWRTLPGLLFAGFVCVSGLSRGAIMDGNRFDSLAKSMSTQRTRRGVLKHLGAAVAGGLAALGFGRAGAAPGGQGKGQGNQCGGPGKQCKRNIQCCQFAELVCLNGICAECPDNFCAGTGVCAPACTDGKVFNASSCSCECPENTCGATGACVAACTDGKVFNAETCACECVPNTCCHCRDGGGVLQSCPGSGLTETECEAICEEGGWRPTYVGLDTIPGATWACGGGADPEDPDCTPVCTP
jgi:hypothetical protein